MDGRLILPTILAFATLTACARSHEWVLSDSAYGPLRFGSTLAQAERVAGAKAEPVYGDRVDNVCGYVRFETYPHMRFMVEQGRILRGEAEAGVPNTLGITVGTTVDELRTRFPGMEVRPHKYDPNGHTLLFGSANGKSALVMEATKGRITQVRAGVRPTVEYVEGCG